MKKLFTILSFIIFSWGLSAQNCLDLDLNVNDVMCYDGDDGTVNISINNGNAPYTYNWGTSSHISGNSYTIPSLSTGNYTLNVSDANGCTYQDDFSVMQPDSLFQTVSGFLCGAGCWCISSQPMGGTPPYSYNWSNGDTIQTVIYCDSSTYTITITDSNGCMAIGATSVAIVSVPFGISTFNISPIVCGDDCTGGVSMEIFGGIPPYTYHWSNGATTKDVLGLCSGEAFVTVVDASLHSVVRAFQIPENEPVRVNDVEVVYINDCGNDCTGSITASAIGGIAPYAYFWNGDGGFTANTQSIENLCEGIYTLSVIDDLDCLYTRDFSVLCQSQALEAFLDVVQPSCVGCCDGSIEVNPSGGYLPYGFSWSDTPFDTSDLRDSLCEGTYTITLTDANDDEIIFTVILDATVSVSELVNSTIKISPNPIQNSFALELDLKKQTKLSAVLMDINGREMSTIMENRLINAGLFRQKIDIHSYPSGLYFLSIFSDNSPGIIQKIVKL